jgi:hypothetical protein
MGSQPQKSGCWGQDDSVFRISVSRGGLGLLELRKTTLVLFPVPPRSPLPWQCRRSIVSIWRLFAALYGTEDAPELGPQLFLLAHLLMKYKVLVYTGPVEGGKLRFTHPKLGEVFDVADLPLDAADFAKINAEVEQQALSYVGPEEAPSAQ